MTYQESICLNMIVKNEAHVIKDTLENICSNISISYYVISDTGSTDNTKEIIKNFFDSINIKGEIFDDPWVDFGKNRTIALEHAYKKTKYLLIFDADDKIMGNFVFPQKLDYDIYQFKFGNSTIYKRPLLINNNLKWSFVGVLHEYLSCNEPNFLLKEYSIEGDYYIDSGKTGNRSTDPNKYYKDALILEKAFYEAEKNNDNIKIRYSFYTAQSYRDCNLKDKAIEWYKKRASLNGWNQEIYYSYYMIGKLYMDLNEEEKAIYYWLLAYEIDTDRYESIYEIILHFQNKKKYKLAYQYYLMIKNLTPNLNDKLFALHPIYQSELDNQMSIIFYYNQKYKEGINTFKKLFSKNYYDAFDKSLIHNFMFYLDYIQYDQQLFENYFNFIKNIDITNVLDNVKKTVNKFSEILNNYTNLDPIKSKLKNKSSPKVLLSITSCKRYDLFKKTVNSLLTNFKDIELIDYFFCIDDNSSKEDRKDMLLNYPFFQYYFKDENTKGHLNSMNIIWNKLNELKPIYWLHIEDDWLFIKPDNYIERSINFLEKYKYDNIHQILFNRNYIETFDDYDMVGGKELEKGYLLHIKDEPNLQRKNCAYWTHYSFRPSMCLTKTILELGDFTSFNTFFEGEYSFKYFKNGYKSAFFNEITSLHIGRLTKDINNNTVKNAYQLNDIKQFNDKFKYCIISDNQYSSNKLNVSVFIKDNTINANIFLKNDFGSNKYIVQTLYTQLKIFNKILHNNNNVEYYIITNNKDIDQYLDSNITNIIKDNNEYDIIFLKEDINLSIDKNFTYKIHKYNSYNINHSYIIHKRSINKLIDYIKINGFIKSNIIDIFLKNNLLIGETDDIFIPYNTEIKNNNECIDLNYLTLNNSNYIFLKNQDHYGNDIYYNNKSSNEELLYYCDLNEDIIAFNTFGYFKNKIDIDNLIKVNDNHGMYVNIERYNKIYNKKINLDKSNNYLIFKDLKNTNLKDNLINLSMLISNKDNIDTIIDYNKYIEDNYTNFNIKDSFIKIVGEYLFIKNYDHVGDDIHFNNNMTINQMIEYANNNEDCVSFNTLGFFKNNIKLNNLDTNQYINKDNHGIFIKIKKLISPENNILKIKNINTLDEDFKKDDNDNYIAYHSLGYYKKELDLKNPIFELDVYNNYLYIDIPKLYQNKLSAKNNSGKIRIKLICNYCTSKDLCKEINKISMGMLLWKNIEFTHEDDFIDYFVIINGIFEDTYFIPEKTIFFINDLKNNIDQEHNFIKKKYLNQFIWNLDKTYFDLKYNILKKEYNRFFINNTLEYYTELFTKQKINREIIKTEIIRNSNSFQINYNNQTINIDTIILNENINNNDMLKYKYTIIIEDSSNERFITQKVFDAILAECLIFYYSENKNLIFGYLDQESIIMIDEKDDINKIMIDAINNNLWEKRINNIRNEKLKILDKYNFLESII